MPTLSDSLHVESEGSITAEVGIVCVSISSPFPSLAQLVAALQRLDADALAGWAVGDEESRKRLRDRIRRIQARLSAEIIDQTVSNLDQFRHEQEDTVDTMLALLNQWAAMLKILRHVEIEIAETATHANSNDMA